MLWKNNMLSQKNICIVALIMIFNIIINNHHLYVYLIEFLIIMTIFDKKAKRKDIVNDGRTIMNMKYLDMFIKKALLKNDLEIIAIWKKRSTFTKDVTESMSIYVAILKLMENEIISYNNFLNKCNVYIIGDGCQPYVGILIKKFLGLKNINCIDPNLSVNKSFHGINCYKEKIEDLIISEKDRNQNSLLISVHGHGNISDFYKLFTGNKIFISLPCCSDFGFVKNEMAKMEYTDTNILSPKNKIFIYYNLNFNIH